LEALDFRILYAPDAGQPLVAKGEIEGSTEETDVGDHPEWMSDHRLLLIADQSDRKQLTVRGEPEGLEDVQETIKNLDFSEEAMYIEQRVIDDCRQPLLTDVTIQPDRFDTSWCGRLRDPDVDCEADEKRLQALFVTVPEPVDDKPDRRGSQWSQRCPTAALKSNRDEGADGSNTTAGESQ
jgi:hypothetical protein